ncbi:MAG: hypothetical protein DRK00_08580 [Thermoprotei archaeon]|nr:MAG: hypothetical protein DRK00_08580 [Thermoprotei archaeon]
MEKDAIRGEVYVRRALSALYFSLFNYWMAKKYDRGERGLGPKQDSFKYGDFHGELLDKALDAQIVYLFSLRVASDHYALNPTIIKIYNGGRIKGRRYSYITIDSLKRAIEAAKEILAHI